MPSRNIVRYDMDDSYYHVYFRGLNRMPIFSRDEDKQYFMQLLGRHLSINKYVGYKGYVYAHYRGELEILSFCVMDNHVHFLIYQHSKGAVSGLLKSVMVAYCAYYNRRYGHRGTIYESRYKAARISDDVYFTHVSRYIHLNPKSWRRYQFSSFIYITKNRDLEWLQPGRLLEQFKSARDYRNFVIEYEGRKRELDQIKREIES